MLQKLLIAIGLLLFSLPLTAETKISVFPSLHAHHEINSKLISLTEQALNLSANKLYRQIKIQVIYNERSQPQALIVYLLSAKSKSVEFVRINLNNDMTAANIIYNYEPTLDDETQSPSYAQHRTPHCPDQSVQFVIGNNFPDDASVAKEVRAVYELAQQRGYRPYLMDVNNSKGPQPTIAAYQDWLSCPNVKGFYNESHGFPRGIILDDGSLLYSHIDAELKNKLTGTVILFDSCKTFRDPLLSSITHTTQGNAQQYTGGYYNLPFGPSERTAHCFWAAAFDQRDIDKTMLNACAKQNDLAVDNFRLTGNGSKRMRAAG